MLGHRVRAKVLHYNDAYLFAVLAVIKKSEEHCGVISYITEN
jgi:Mg2+/citrate symporter